MWAEHNVMELPRNEDEWFLTESSEDYIRVSSSAVAAAAAVDLSYYNGWMSINCGLPDDDQIEQNGVAIPSSSYIIEREREGVVSLCAASSC